MAFAALCMASEQQSQSAGLAIAVNRRLRLIITAVNSSQRGTWHDESAYTQTTGFSCVRAFQLAVMQDMGQTWVIAYKALFPAKLVKNDDDHQTKKRQMHGSTSGTWTHKRQRSAQTTRNEHTTDGNLSQEEYGTSEQRVKWLEQLKAQGRCYWCKTKGCSIDKCPVKTTAGSKAKRVALNPKYWP